MLFLMSWVDRNGVENIDQIINKTGNPITTTITDLDVIGNINIKDRQRDYIFTDIVLNFGWDGENYLHKIGPTKTYEDLTSQEKIDNFVDSMGFVSDDLKVRLWNLGRELYLRYNTNNVIPPDVQNLEFTQNYGTTNVNENASQTVVSQLFDLYRYQGAYFIDFGTIEVVPSNFLEFSIDYQTARAGEMEMGKRFYSKFAHETLNISTESLVYGIKKDLVNLKYTIMARIVSSNYESNYIQDTNDESVDEWQDNIISGQEIQDSIQEI